MKTKITFHNFPQCLFEYNVVFELFKIWCETNTQLVIFNTQLQPRIFSSTKKVPTQTSFALKSLENFLEISSLKNFQNSKSLCLKISFFFLLYSFLESSIFFVFLSIFTQNFKILLNNSYPHTKNMKISHFSKKMTSKKSYMQETTHYFCNFF